MSQSTPSQPPLQSQHRSLAPTATPRFSPYPPAALRTSLFHQPFRHSTPSSASNPLLSTPRSLALPSRTSSPYTNGRLPSAPQNTPLSATSSSSFGPHRSTPLGLSSTLSSATVKRGQKNPFDKLTATDFDQFVNGLRDKVKNALDPEIERKRRKEEREDRQRIRDEKERERERIEKEKEEIEMENSKPSMATKDVFGEVKNVSANDEKEDEEDGEDEDEDEDENLVNGQEVKIDPNQPVESSEEDVSYSDEEAEDEEEEEPLVSKGPKTKGKPVEIVILDSDEEEEEREDERRSSLEREESIDDGDEEFSDGEELETGDSGTEEDELQPVSSRSPTPNSVSSPSPRKSLHQPSRAAPYARPSIEYPSLSVSTSRQSTDGLDEAVTDSNNASRRLSSSPDATSRQPRIQNRERSPLFRPRNEGSVSVSAPEDYHLEVDQDYFSQEESGDFEEEQRAIAVEENGNREMKKVSGEDGDDFYRDVFESTIRGQHDEDQSQAEEQESGEVEARDEEEEGMFDLPPVSQRKKRDAFGRPIRYQEEDGEGGEFDGYEEEEGFGEDVQDEVLDYQLFDPGQGVEEESSSLQAQHGTRLEDLVEQSVKEADRISEEAAEKVETQKEPENLGTIELDDSDEDEPVKEYTQSNPDVQEPVAPLTVPSQPQLTTPFDLLAAAIAPNPTSSDIQLDEALQVATSTSPLPFSIPASALPLTTETLPQPSFPTSDQFLPQAPPHPLSLPQSVLQDEISYDFRTPPEAQEELLDVDQVRVREMERLPFLQEAEIGKAFEGYEDQELQDNEVNTSKDVEMQLDGETVEVEIKVDGDEENTKVVEDSPQNPGEEEGEYFGEGVPGDEVVPGGELESEDEGSDRRANYSGEDSEDLRPRIPYEAKGKGRALPTPSLDSDDPSRFTLSEQEEEDAYSQSSDYESDEDHPWKPELLLDYDLRGLERLMQVLGSQLKQARSSRNQARIRQQLEDVQEFYINKGGELFDEDDEDDEGGDERDDIDENGVSHETFEDPASQDDDYPPLSPDRSAFDQPTKPSEEDLGDASLNHADRQARDQVLSIASQLVDLQSSSNPYPSLRIGSSSIDHPEANFSTHFRQEDAPQPKLDDPINLPPPPPTSTSVDEPVQSQQQDSELNIERVVADEQRPIELPKGEETKLDIEMQEQADQVDHAPTQGDGGGLTIVDDDYSFDTSTSSRQLPQVDDAVMEESKDPLPSASQVEITAEKSLPPLSEAESKSKTQTTHLPTISAVSTSTAPRDEISTSNNSPSVESSKALPPVPATPNSKSSSFDPSPFLPLPPSATSSISRNSAPDLSRFSSHFRFEPNGPPPPLDAPLNLSAPPSSTTNVDEPIIREQQDEELEPEIQALNEEEVNEMHKLSEMVDLSHDVKPHEAEDFERPQKEELMTIIDDDESPPPTPQPVKFEEQELDLQTPVVERRSRIGATPPPPSVAFRSEDSMITEGSAPPQNPALLPTPLPPTPSLKLEVLPLDPIQDSTSLPPQTSASELAGSLSQPPTEGKKISTSLAADEIRFDDIVGDQSLEEDEEEETSLNSDSDNDNDNDESEAEVAHVLLSPHKRSGGVLGFSGGADEFGETILMNSDSEEEEADEVESEPTDTTTRDVEVEELDLDSVKMALRKQNEEAEEEKKHKEKSEQRQVSEAPSSEPISYASSDEREEEGKSITEYGVFDESGHFDQGDFGGGLEEGGLEQIDDIGDLPASPNRPNSTALHIHDVLEPGEWNPSEPIEFGTSAAASHSSKESKAGNLADNLNRGFNDAEAYTRAERDAPLVAVVEMGQPEETSNTKAPKENASIAEEVAQNVAEALAAELNSDERLPAIEVAPEVIEEAVRPSEPEHDTSTAESNLEESALNDNDSRQVVPQIQVPPAEPSIGAADAAPASDQSESGDEILLASRPSRSSARRTPRQSTSAPREDRASTSGRPSLSADTLEVPSPMRRSSRLSSAGPASSSTDSPSSSRGKRSRRSDENGAAAPSTSNSSVKKPKRTGHGLKYREEVTEDEEPAPIAGSSRTNLRLHHHHHQPAEGASTSSQTSKFEPPVTRSRCHFTRLKLTSLFNKDSPPYEFLVPACALTSPIAIETMKRSAVQNLGAVDESMHCRGTPLGGRGFDSDAAKLMSDRHPSRLVPDEDVLDVVRRIVGTEIFDEGEVELLPRQVDETQQEERMDGNMGEREEGEIEEGEVVE
ncbi:hypothetical protein JCM3765_005951 [Sporobolomyces pararoseus]